MLRGACSFKFMSERGPYYRSGPSLLVTTKRNYPTPLGLHSVRKQAAVPPMAVALMKPRSPAGRAIGFLPLLFDTIYVSAVPSPSSMNAEDPKKKKNLFGVAQFLPNWGIGYKMAKTHWRDVSYEISKVNLDKVFSSLPLVDGRHGKARGIWYKAGEFVL
ncbi:hypothetical protein BHM03_00031455 [Ensete ventricosum]|nr:hypothetical protein BHM03_00031455 [Ensete ventricosum]